MSVESIDNPEVAAVFRRYPRELREKLLALRKLILETAEDTEGVGEIEETLKWGEPAYLTSQTKSGSTIRIGVKRTQPERAAIFFNCQTNLVESYRLWFADEFTFDGNRGIVFDADDDLPLQPLAICIAAALTYHRDKRKRRS
ncbi:MAG: DUF1801 domain-containing protein [Rhodothermales bacterium]|nr:DUF1801 domain-containing protein [Rhodothermales bacterium]